MEVPDFFNVFATAFEPMDNEYFGSDGAEGRSLHLSADNRHLAVATRYPKGVKFFYGGEHDVREAFYVVEGRGTRTFADGSTVEMQAGDFIFVQPGVGVQYVYEPGFADVAVFWSDQPLPSSLYNGLSHASIGEA